MDGIIWLLAWATGASFDQSYAVFKEIQISTKIRVIPSGPFSKLRT